MTDMMSYQYPPPPQNGGDLDLPHSGYLSNYQTSAASSLEVRNQQVPAVHLTQPVLPAQGSTMSLAQRRDLNKALKLRRPETTPNVRTQGTNESAHGQFGSAGEKKRNKLGYHRTSVACTHCRRRKIRCIPYVNDPQGRCQNCIRLKKECTFHSVGQDIPPSNTQRPGVRTGPGPKIASASTSPVATTGHQSAISPNQPYPQITSVSSHMGPPIKPESFSRDAKLSTSTPTTRNFQYSHNANSWVSTDTGANPAKTPDMNASWRSYTQDSPVTPGFSSYTTHPHTTSPWPTGAMGTPVSNDSTSRHDEIAWSPYPTPGRSLSYGGGENSQNYAPVPSHVAAAGSAPNSVYDRRSSMAAAASDMYPPGAAGGIATTIPNVESSIPGTALDPSGSLSAGAVPTQAGYGAPWQAQPYTYSKTGDGYEGWYSTSGQTPTQVPSNTDHSPQSVYYASR
ncbi:hypothetical protein PFICI_01352 [Pestalotiopsis fici W106-1]|uniref:Zn(2)-C6 fungal-type domain-containing protein n=1 Tax=Pestalotiopsis fici (strain W106-1 / CGMCC3.15140) TaxID=1229662 RepID=W3XNG1_PESFW|nr:uncharacterized protein PFICI_01352 [Pestalotiopsis fici W106-1]ETS87524.1 hypothetical protein PFICI_01352 [Pestalotiopsis fici W106-1]